MSCQRPFDSLAACSLDPVHDDPAGDRHSGSINEEGFDETYVYCVPRSSSPSWTRGWCAMTRARAGCQTAMATMARRVQDYAMCVLEAVLRTGQEG